MQTQKKNRQSETWFQVEGDEPVDTQPITVRLPCSISPVVRSLPNRSAWLRRVITEAAQRELMGDGQS